MAETTIWKLTSLMSNKELYNTINEFYINNWYSSHYIINNVKSWLKDEFSLSEREFWGIKSATDEIIKDLHKRMIKKYFKDHPIYPVLLYNSFDSDKGLLAGDYAFYDMLDTDEISKLVVKENGEIIAYGGLYNKQTTTFYNTNRFRALTGSEDELEKYIMTHKKWRKDKLDLYSRPIADVETVQKYWGLAKEDYRKCY